MDKTRVEAFSDGVIAVIITIIVLEMKVPLGPDLAALTPMVPVFLSYVLSFVYVGIYWNNHHRMFKLTATVNGTVLWANLHLLFWLSLLPFTTGWMGENHFQRWPTVLYGINLLLCALAYLVLQSCLIRHQGNDSRLAKAVSTDFKGKVSPVLYVAGILTAWMYSPRAGTVFFVVVALIWLVPDRRTFAVLPYNRRQGRAICDMVTLDGEALGDVDELAAAVIALARQALGVFVGENRALRFQNGAGYDVLRGDELDLVALPAEF